MPAIIFFFLIKRVISLDRYIDPIEFWGTSHLVYDLCCVYLLVRQHWASSYIPCYLIVCQHYHVGVEQVMGIEPTSNPWQGLIITIILYLHLISLASSTMVCPHSRLRVICARLWREVGESNTREQGHNLPFYH